MPSLLNSIANVAKVADPTLNQMMLLGGGLNQNNLQQRLNAVSAIDANELKKKRDAILQGRDDETYKLAHQAALRHEMDQEDERKRRIGYLSALKALPANATIDDRAQVLARFYPEKAAQMRLNLARTKASLAEAGYRNRMPQPKPAKFDDKLGASVVGEALLQNNIRPVNQLGEQNPTYKMFLDLIVPQLRYYPPEKWNSVISYYLKRHKAWDDELQDQQAQKKDEDSNFLKTTKQIGKGTLKAAVDYVKKANQTPVTTTGLAGLELP